MSWNRVEILRGETKSISELEESTGSMRRIYSKQELGKKQKETNKTNETIGVEHMEDHVQRVLEGSKLKWGTTGGAMKAFNHKGREEDDEKARKEGAEKVRGNVRALIP